MDENDCANLGNELADRLTRLTGRVWNADDRKRLESWLEDAENRDVGLAWLTAASPDGHVDESEAEFVSRLRIQSGLTGKGGDLGGFRGL